MHPDSPVPARPAGTRLAMTSPRALLAFAVVFAAVYGLLAWFAAGVGVRGTDQYWYLADTDTLVRDHLITTNVIFPVGLLGPGGTLTPAFVHNVLGIYLAAIPALLAGSYGGWLVLNVVATLATAALIFLAARTVASRWAAIICAVLYPLLPVTFWHATQPLTEVSTALFASLAIYLLAIAGTSTRRWLAVVVAVGLLYYSRESYLPLLLAVPIGFVVARAVEGPGRIRSALAPMAVLWVAVIVVAGLGRIAFGATNVAFSYARLALTAVPGVSDNMWFNFDLSPANLADRLPFRADLLPEKLIGHLSEQFVAFDNLPLAVFYWTFNLLSIVALVMLWRSRHRPRQLRLVVAALALVAIHIVTITLFQNQARYTVPALPGLLVVLAIALSEIPWLARLTRPRTLIAVLVICLLAAGPLLFVARTQRVEAADYGATERETRTLLDAHLGPAEPAIIVYADQPQVFGYAAGRRPVLYVTGDYSDEEYDRLRHAFPAHWLLAPVGSPATSGIGAAATPVGIVDGGGLDWGLYPLAD